MNFSSAEFRKLGPALAILIALLAAGGGLIFWTKQEVRAAERELTSARTDRSQARERLTRIAEEEKEVNDKLEIYRRLKSLHILGEEQRLEWADAMTRIRTSRELLDMRYSVERQRLLLSAPGKPANVDFHASTMKVDIALLHEGDLLAFLRDLRESGNAFYSVKRCQISRTGIRGHGRLDRAAPASGLRDRPDHYSRSGGEGMKAAIALISLCAGLLASAAAGAQELGRLFFTPEQRAALDARRKARVPDKPAATPQAELPVTRINGAVQRSGGRSTVWVNGEAVPEGSPSAGAQSAPRVADRAA
jgi:hypothetical protein